MEYSRPFLTLAQGSFFKKVRRKRLRLVRRCHDRIVPGLAVAAHKAGGICDGDARARTLECTKRLEELGRQAKLAEASPGRGRRRGTLLA